MIGLGEDRAGNPKKSSRQQLDSSRQANAAAAMTFPTAFAETTRFSTTSADLRYRVLNLYRRYLRHSREFVNSYDLDIPAYQVKTKIRQEFERHRFVQDLATKNVLYMKGQMEFQELVNFWKQQCHVMQYFEDFEHYSTTSGNSFVQKFLKGAN
ncbi:hypothetical protein PMKS-001331 [Pichia membranifaciens]|uniref:Complex 1 LYR protein domain-containing protein n=2 Tax=Pichia membranifaciens TaxID=4926 RepID=A0A1Q2YEP4_9ASCO|nr:hypothetical protein PMKS-001331 [Pichia membranifaciens]